MKIIKRGLPLLLVVLAGITYFNYPKLNIISGFAAKNMASNRFIASRSVASVIQSDHNVPMIKLADIEVGENDVAAAVYGLMERRAICSEGLGCVLINDDFNINAINYKPKRTQKANGLPFPYGDAGDNDSIFKNVDYGQIKKAVDIAFENPEIQKTRTVLVAYKNHILAEKYATGFNKDTPILGWSMTKSVLATLYGILEFEGKIDLNNPAPVASWQQDERKNISLNHLFRMQSGLAWEEDYTGISDVTRMLFLDADMTASQKDKEAIAKPTAIWNYSSGTSNLLSGILRD
ncbi:MAG: serine hydrolase, partial [Maribacter sp.]|nr:serine hydrolase [Maribacter sp.]